jgi:hypothetical protein
MDLTDIQIQQLMIFSSNNIYIIVLSFTQIFVNPHRFNNIRKIMDYWIYFEKFTF